MRVIMCVREFLVYPDAGGAREPKHVSRGNRRAVHAAPQDCHQGPRAGGTDVEDWSVGVGDWSVEVGDWYLEVGGWSVGVGDRSI